MKNRLFPHLIMLVIAVLAGTLFVTWNSLSNVSACVQAPGCTNRDLQPLGTMTTRNYGFPAVYKQTVTFKPANNDQRTRNYAGYASASAVTKAMSWPIVLVNVIFWFALLFSLYTLLRRFGITFSKSATPRPAAAEDVEPIE